MAKSVLQYKLSYDIIGLAENHIKEVIKLVYPYRETGKRIKEARSSIPKLTQKELAKIVGVDPNYIAMLERGARPLTEGMAYKIGKACNVLPEYLLLQAEKPNVGAAIDIQAEHNLSLMWNAFIDYVCQKAGYNIERVHAIDIPEDLNKRIVCSFSKDSDTVLCDSETINDFFEDITDYAVMKLCKMITKKAGER